MKKRKIRSVAVGALFFFYSVAAGIVSYFLVCKVLNVSERRDAELGEAAVKLLYDFGTAEQLDYQMQGLKEITTEPVFNQLTIDNEERTLNTYLKFKNEPVTVEVARSTNQYVIYSLDTKNISKDRIFVFFFTVNGEGKIDSVREVEAIDFVDGYR